MIRQNGQLSKQRAASKRQPSYGMFKARVIEFNIARSEAKSMEERIYGQQMLEIRQEVH